MMLPTSWTSSSKKSWGFMVFHKLSFQIGTWNFYLTFRDPYGDPWGLSCSLALLCNPQTDGQMEVKNKSLITLLSRIVSKSLRDWDFKLTHTRFVYNRAPFYATSHSPFEMCYGLNPFTPIDLTPIPQESKVSFEAEARAKEMKRLRKQVRVQM